MRLPTADSPPLTVRMLLTMSAGLVEDDSWADRQLDMPPDAFEALLASGLRLSNPPGIRWEYSNLGYSILGRVVAAAAGRPLREVADERILRPLGMADTAWDV